MYNPFSLSGKKIIITGASSGIGRQCAIDCSKMGATVILVARNEKRLKETQKEMQQSERHSYYSIDLGQPDRIKELVETIVVTHGKLDGFIHAAGIEKTLPVKLLSIDDYETLFRVNTLSAFEFIRCFSNKKFFNDNGHIVLLSSITSIIGRGGVAAYAASKGGYGKRYSLYGTGACKKRYLYKLCFTWYNSHSHDAGFPIDSF